MHKTIGGDAKSSLYQTPSKNTPNKSARQQENIRITGKSVTMSSVGSPKKLQQTMNARNIPSRRMIINDVSQMPIDYSSTPGGTLFSTTPGGTRIIYDRAFLMQLRNSPMAKSPPKNLPTIPGVTTPVHGKENKPIANNVTNDLITSVALEGMVEKSTTEAPTAAAEPVDEPQFEMDI